MEDLTKLPNIGLKLASELERVGISSFEALEKLGSVEALLRINGLNYEDGCLNKLYALEGAIVGIRWHHLEVARKHSIKSEYFLRIGRA